jgi:hypothetical protein
VWDGTREKGVDPINRRVSRIRGTLYRKKKKKKGFDRNIQLKPKYKIKTDSNIDNVPKF